MPKNSKLEIGFPTKAGYIGVKVPSNVMILGMKVNTKIILILVGMILIGTVIWMIYTYTQKK